MDWSWVKAQPGSVNPVLLSSMSLKMLFLSPFQMLSLPLISLLASLGFVQGNLDVAQDILDKSDIQVDVTAQGNPSVGTPAFSCYTCAVSSHHTLFRGP